jgi:hypothetical protein
MSEKIFSSLFCARKRRSLGCNWQQQAGGERETRVWFTTQRIESETRKPRLIILHEEKLLMQDHDYISYLSTEREATVAQRSERPLLERPLAS